MAVVTLTIDDRHVSARDDETILAVAREAGVAIPTLCQLDGVSAASACRLCLVEVEGSNRLQASCVTRVAENMIVNTATEKLREYLVCPCSWTCFDATNNGQLKKGASKRPNAVPAAICKASWKWCNATSCESLVRCRRCRKRLLGRGPNGVGVAEG